MHSINSYKVGWVIYCSAIILFSCANSNKITVAFTEVGLLRKGSTVYTGEIPIGKVVNYKSNKNHDTIFIALKINNKNKIPKGSIFYIDENLIGNSKIIVDYSNNKNYLSKKDVVIGEFRALKRQ